MSTFGETNVSTCRARLQVSSLNWIAWSVISYNTRIDGSNEIKFSIV